MSLNNVTLEISLKPFTDPSEPAVRKVCRHLFDQWKPLLREADGISVMLWSADGSEILDYTGDLSAPFEWARYIGHANPSGVAHWGKDTEDPGDSPTHAPPTKFTSPNDPEGLNLHSRNVLYTEHPPTFTYGWLQQLLVILKEVGREVTGKPVRVGATFDPGPEFAKSPFKYERHREICLGGTMGRASFVGCYATLHADDRRYAGFPDGIPEGTSFGAFLGRQSQHFLTDLGFDYIWFSNGFGFGIETWGYLGPLFDGKEFKSDRVPEIREKSLAFWNDFRRECPAFLIETRGTNLSTGMDLSSDAVPLRDIYRGSYHLTPPPNSPWAAIDGDFGLELVGWMSHIAELPPEEKFPFRLYTHDPWWLNSPWLDRYGREPHDIYLPLAVARLDRAGRAQTPSSFEILTADDSYGHLPDQVPLETIPHLLAGHRDAPDKPGPLVWVYPFDEYHDMTFGPSPRLAEVFFGDWFMRGAVNRGLPLHTVISTTAFAQAWSTNAHVFQDSILVAPTAALAGPARMALEDAVRQGGRLLLYGPTENLDKATREWIGVQPGVPMEGDFRFVSELESDRLTHAEYPSLLRHDPLTSAGPLCEVARSDDPSVRLLARAIPASGEEKALATERRPGSGHLVWVRGSNTFDCHTHGRHPRPLDPASYYPSDMLPRLLLSRFGFDIRFAMRGPDPENPMLFEPGVAENSERTPIEVRDRITREPLSVIARHANGFFFSGYVPETTATMHLRLPQGAPLLVGCETRLDNGRATYSMPRAWHRECRVFVDGQETGELSCIANHSGEIGVSRRLRVLGLRNATLRFYPEPGSADRVRILLHPSAPYLVGDFLKPEHKRDALGDRLEVHHVTGTVLITW